jgi:hypothetical protein
MFAFCVGEYFVLEAYPRGDAHDQKQNKGFRKDSSVVSSHTFRYMKIHENQLVLAMEIEILNSDRP